MSQPYESYKPSGIDWLGDIPSHWDAKRLKLIADVNPLQKSFVIKKEDKVVFLPMEKVSEKGEISQELFKRVGDVENGLTYFERNDVILAKITPCFENGKGAYLENLDTDYGFGSTEFHVIRATDKTSPKFLQYLIRGDSFMQIGEASMTGSAGQKRIPTAFVENFPVSLPPLTEQRAIAAYLDRKTAQIDQLLARKEQLLTLLQQKRQAIINEAVTRGLDADATNKDSGIEWLGEIPAHWEVKKLKYVASLKSGDTITSETIDEEGAYPVYGGGGFRGYTSAYTHEGHHVLIGRQGALCGNINYAKSAFWASEHALVVSLLGDYETIWLGELLRTMNLNQYSQSSAQPGISADRIENLHIPVPPLNEQTAIVKFILDRGETIGKAVSEIKTQLAHLKTYRQSLISEVVTGKVDVRRAVAVDA